MLQVCCRGNPEYSGEMACLKNHSVLETVGSWRYTPTTGNPQIFNKVEYPHMFTYFRVTLKCPC